MIRLGSCVLGNILSTCLITNDVGFDHLAEGSNELNVYQFTYPKGIRHLKKKLESCQVNNLPISVTYVYTK